MISRKALLISAPGGEINSRPEVNAELEATKNFLLSPRGGAWKAEEIFILINPNIRTITSAVKEMEADYTITYFSGKGFPDNDGNHFLLAGGNDYFQDIELLNASQKQVVIIDDCSDSFDVAKMQSIAEPSDLEKARKMYDKWIENSEPGQLIMHATEAPTVSSERSKAGIFTKKLLQIANSIPSSSDRFNLKSILATGHETPDLLLEEGFEEGPTITWSQGNIKLPFAMALPKPAALLPAIKNQDFNSGLTLGLFFLAFLLNLE